MRLMTNVNEIEEVWIEEPKGAHGIVILFPITRTGPQALVQWQNLLNFVCENSIHSLIIIDKTSGGIAYDFFWADTALAAKKTNLYVLKRSINESHYDSLGGIFLSNNLWIIQFHDDDQWEGELHLPIQVVSNEVILTDFYVSGRNGHPEKDMDITIPARILFSLVPAVLWNKFSQLIIDQERHTAGSLDSTLSLMASVTCNFSKISSFKYFYDDRNWRNNRESRKHLIDLAEKDGWRSWASPEIAVLNRSFDALAALSYCSDLASPEVIQAKKESILNSMRPKLKVRTLGRIKYIFTLKFIAKRKGNSLAKVITKSWGLTSIASINPFIESFLETRNLPDLNARFRYWKQIFGSVDFQKSLEEISSVQRQ